MKLLILGGYGTFGGRLAQLLADDSRLTLLIAGRSKKKAQEFCNRLPLGAERIALAFNRDQNPSAQIRELKPDLVVDATGPFQIYGDDPYRVVKACIENGVHYMDLADASDFVKGIETFDVKAREKGVFVLGGVSSFPVLSAAVVRRLSKDMARVDSITGGIAPSPYAGVGLNVIRAISSYAGKPLRLVRNGKPASAYALTETMRFTISPPGRVPLSNTLFSLVDVPDLLVLPDLWPGAKSVWLGAGPVPEILHRMLIGLAWLVRWRILSTLKPLAPLFHFVINIFRWGDHRGGMFMSVCGKNENGDDAERSWHLLAEGNDGPFIPSMAVMALVKKILSGTQLPTGARPATKELELADYESIFQTRTITTGERVGLPAETQSSLYVRLLESAFDNLPAPVQSMHSYSTESKVTGRANVDVGTNRLAHFAARLMKFPGAGRDVPVQVLFQPSDKGELWTRTFADQTFSSFQSAGRGRYERLLRERFGPITFHLALLVDGDKLRLVTRHWSLFGIPLPLFLAPHSDAYESATEGRFNFHVQISHWLTGLIIRYEGWLGE